MIRATSGASAARRRHRHHASAITPAPSRQYIRSGAFKTILVIGSEVHSTRLDISTACRDVTVLFGDGAGAVVIGRATDEAHMIPSTHIHADSSKA